MSSNLQIVVWDVKHGNAIYMKTPNDRNVMFDIGTRRYGNEQEFSPLEYLKNSDWEVNYLHYLVISHPHADHISDIKNMFALNLRPGVLRRPIDINSDVVRDSNQPKDSEIVNLYLELDSDYNTPISGGWLDSSNPLNYGDVKMSFFRQIENGTHNLNNYSIVAVISYSSEKIIIPGDIEAPGWKKLLENENFQQAIEDTTIFVASHHGREAGYYNDVFNYFKPDVVIVSDGKYSGTSVTEKYNYHAQGFSVKSRRTRESKTRKVLTTRNDGAIYIRVDDTEKFITIK